ncbi:restriction endonuclease subunit S [Gemmiger formicilis]|uniref:restriction endonuclease subunit S n=1 Tax=Gemmiger formicilis TaxID=745368 RepID=UPI00399BA47C
MAKQNKPAIRFKGFTDAWEQRKLFEMCGTFEYGLNAAAKEFDGKNKYIRITDIDDASREFLLSDLSSPDICLDGMSKYLLSSGDIVFARTGASVGKTYIYRENDGIVYFAGFLIRAKVNQDNDAEFVFQSTLSPSYEKYIRITSQRSGQPGVNAQEYGEYDLFAPSKEEQQRIGHFLRGIDSLITLHQRKYDKLQVLKKAMLEKMFPKNGSSVPEIRFKGFTDAWEQRKLGELLKTITTGKSVNSDDGAVAVGDIGILKTSCVSYDRFNPYESKPVVKDELQSVKCAVEKDSVIVSRMNTPERVGACGYVSTDFPNLFLPDRLWKLKFQDNVDAYFVYMMLVSSVYKEKITSMASGTSGSMYNIPKETFLNLQLVVPVQTSEQRKIGQVLRQLNDLITLHQRELEKLQNIKKSMLEKMFV